MIEIPKEYLELSEGDFPNIEPRVGAFICWQLKGIKDALAAIAWPPTDEKKDEIRFPKTFTECFALQEKLNQQMGAMMIKLRIVHDNQIGLAEKRRHRSGR